MNEAQRLELFEEMKSLLRSYGEFFSENCEPKKYSLSTTKPIPVDGKVREGFYFAGLREQKNIVGFYFMPIYTCPELRNLVPTSLARVLKGNTCFNLTALDETRALDLHTLMKLGMDAYQAKDWL